jgi:hypothetical protein
MSVTDQLPSKVGQRVQEIFTDSRGWVMELGEDRDGRKVAVIEWDAPEPNLGEDDSKFPVDALRVVEMIRIDADVFEDPSKWDEVEQTTTGTEYGTVFKLKNGMVFKGIDTMRLFMLGYHTRTWA